MSADINTNNTPSNGFSIAVEVSKDVLGDGKYYVTFTRQGEDEPYDGLSALASAEDATWEIERFLRTAIHEWNDRLCRSYGAIRQARKWPDGQRRETHL